MFGSSIRAVEMMCTYYVRLLKMRKKPFCADRAHVHAKCIVCLPTDYSSHIVEGVVCVFCMSQVHSSADDDER